MVPPDDLGHLPSELLAPFSVATCTQSPAGPVYHTPLSSYGGEEAPHNTSNMRAGLDLGSTFLYSGETRWGGRWTMLPTREAITENLAERLCWEAARRDGTRVARRL